MSTPRIPWILLTALAAGCGGRIDNASPSDAPSCPPNRVCGGCWSLVAPPESSPIATSTSGPHERVEFDGVTITEHPFDGTLEEYVRTLAPDDPRAVTYELKTIAGQSGIVARMPGQVRRYAFLHAGHVVAVDFDVTVLPYRDTWESSIDSLEVTGP